MGLGTLVVGTLWGIVLYTYQNLQPITPLINYTPFQTLYILDHEGQDFGREGPVQREITPLAKIPAMIQNAFLVTEDKDFYQHFGLDVFGILRSLIINTSHDRWNDSPLGGSTITQQLVKNLLLTSSKTFDRKLREALLSIKIEKTLGKKRILEIYLNEIYLGRNAYGLSAASKAYFRKSLKDLTLTEIATLAALPKSPHAAKFPDRLKERRNWVLSRLREEGYITFDEMNQAQSQPLSFQDRSYSTFGAYYKAEVRRQLKHVLSDENVYRKGLRVYTCMHPHLQTIADTSLTQHLNKLPEGLTGAVIIMEAASGRVLALTGGRDFKENQFNNATQAYRQAGSVFKTFVYLAALEGGLTPFSPLDDGPVLIQLRSGEVYKPRNVNTFFLQDACLWQGLAISQNTMTVRLAQKISLNRITDVAQRLGVFERPYRHYSMVLGSIETTLLKLVTAYGIIANGGQLIKPAFIEAISDHQKRPLWHRPFHPLQQVIRNDIALSMQNMLHQVVEQGTARRLKNLPFWIAGKTGTTNDNKDCWFIGFSGPYVIGVFVGYPTPKSIGDKATGSSIAIPIFEKIVRGIHEISPLPHKERA